MSAGPIMLTEREAWQAIYRKCEEHGTILRGLCLEIDELRQNYKITGETRDLMASRIHHTIDALPGAYLEGFSLDRDRSSNADAWTLRRPIVQGFIDLLTPSSCPPITSESSQETSSDSVSSSVDSIRSNTHSNPSPR